MAVLGRRASTTTDERPPRAQLKVLRADGQRIDLSKRDAGALLVATRQGWQSQAYAYRDLIGELRYALRLRAQSVARCRFYIAQARPWPEDPVPLDGDDHDFDAQLAADALVNFERIPFDHEPDGFTARLDENLGIAGEVWVHIDGAEQFHVRSVSEIAVSPDGRVTLQTLPTATAGTTRVIDPAREDLLRCWVPHPEWGQLADSALRTSLDVCEDVVLAGREQRAAARSRVAANGFLLIPAGLSMLAQRQDDEHDDSVMSDTFMADLTAAMLAPIRDDGDAQAVVPIVLRGDPDDLDKVRHLSVQRADSEELIARQSAALLRLLKGLDIQPEQVEGVGGMNHWGAWIIDARSIRDQVEPAAETIAAAMMQAYMRPVLESLGHKPEDIDQLTIAVDPSPLAENPNRGQDARDAHAAFAIKDETLREALGFGEEDAPDDDELVRRLALSGRLPVDATAALLGLAPQQQPQPVTIDAQPAEPRELPSAEQERPVIQDGEATPARGTPEQPAAERAAPATSPAPAGPIVAAATEPDPYGLHVDIDAPRRLADVDAELADRILVAADAALARVLERAGARVRSQAQKDRALAASIKGLDAHLVPATIGRARVEALVSISDLLADGYARLRGQFERWLGDAAAQVAEILLDLLGIPTRSPRADELRARVRTRLTARTGQAWQTLAERLDAAAEEALFRPDPLVPEETPGEPVDTLLRPQDVEDVLRVAGGAQPIREPGRESSHTRAPRLEETPGPGGFGAGPDVTALVGEEGGVLLGWEWQYRFGIQRGDRFAPWHTGLDKVRFATFTDPKLDTAPETAWIGPYYFPGDHHGCRCRTVPIYAVPDMEDGIVARRLREAQGDPRNVLAAQVAADDDAAGRVGTSLQQEVEVRDRIHDAVQRLEREYIDRNGDDS
ncbi:hypothetical protein [Pseudonocardia zijingensis]|uniref:Phage Mu protein F like protein n=1 Tax=Pseudonocardia zijingensis TaxID=153376 RepID=A0ABN1N901_9PSEU